jgi:hypothetical protein
MSSSVGSWRIGRAPSLSLCVQHKRCAERHKASSIRAGHSPCSHGFVWVGAVSATSGVKRRQGNHPNASRMEYSSFSMDEIIRS